MKISYELNEVENVAKQLIKNAGDYYPNLEFCEDVKQCLLKWSNPKTMLNQTKEDSVIIVAVGKLTNIALALKKDPSFADRTKIVWLGSNYPEPGEYNQDNDTISMNYVLNSKIPFEMVTVRYGDPSGTDAVAVTQDEITKKMTNLGPKATEPITGVTGSMIVIT